MAANYLETLNPVQKHNAQILVQRMKDKGITNPYTWAAVLAVISKESSFVPQSEDLNYSAERIRQVWPRIPVNIAQQLGNRPEQLGNYVYGPEMNKTLGNGPGEGYKYRGRGYNQITGRANYDRIGKAIGVDLINNPDLLNDPKVAADAAIYFFTQGIDSMRRLGKLSAYNATTINDFKNNTDSLGAIYHVNAGIGSTKAKLDADTTGGRAKASSRVDSLLTFVGGSLEGAASTVANTTKGAAEVVKKNPLTTGLIAAGIVLGTYLLYNAFKPSTN